MGLEGKNVYVVIGEYGEMYPYIAIDFIDAVEQHADTDGSAIAGVFIYGNDYVTVK